MRYALKQAAGDLSLVFTFAKEVMFSSSVCLLATLRKNYAACCMKFQGIREGWQWANKQLLQTCSSSTGWFHHVDYYGATLRLIGSIRGQEQQQLTIFHW